jgi:hypothetical protein
MTSLSAADIITKLRFLFIVVMCLFGIMHVGAFIGFGIDASAKCKTMTRICAPSAGFEISPGGVWTWRLQHARLEKAVGAPTGSAVRLSEVFAFPFVRLRVAIPSELMDGSVAQSVGLRAGLSQQGLADAAGDVMTVMGHLSRGFTSIFGRGGGGQIPQLDLVPETPAEKLVHGSSTALHRRFAYLHDDTAPERLVGTALILAHVANQRAMNIVELGERRAAASAHFAGVQIPGCDHSFDALCAMFMLMLGDGAGALTPRKSWLVTARTWRFILLQRADGSWDLSDSLAFALGAHEGPLPPPNNSRLARMRSCLGQMDDLEEAEEAGPDFTSSASLLTSKSDELENVRDCPLTYYRAALVGRMPRELAELRDAEAVWGTLLAMLYLERSPASWMVTEDEEDEVTMVDAARRYLLARCRKSRRLRHLLKSGKPHEAALKALRRWQAAREDAIARTRTAESVSSHRGLHLAQRAVSRIAKSCQTDHDTFSVLLDSSSFIQRWQRWMVLMTVLIAALLCAILFYASRGQQCCSDIRRLLDTGAGQLCTVLAANVSLPGPSASSLLLITAHTPDEGCDPATPTGSCLGHVGACGDLAAQFSTVQGAFVYGTPGRETCHTTLADYVCHAFPDDAYATDQLFVSLICVAIALPVTLFLENMFEAANEVEGARESWLAFGGKWQRILGAHAHADWHWADTARAFPSGLVRWLAANGNPYFTDAVRFFVPYAFWRTVATINGALRPTKETDERKPATDEKLHAKDETGSDAGGNNGGYSKNDLWAMRTRHLRAAGGFIGVYVCWTAFSYFICA